jgi:hypothetical protein
MQMATRLLRTSILRESATGFAGQLNISVSRLSNLEIGSPLSIEVAHKIGAAVPGIALDWHYYGDERTLPISVVDQLRRRAEQREWSR